MINRELVRKHIRHLVEATVKSHTRTSKTGKVFNVKQHERKDEQKAADATHRLFFKGNYAKKWITGYLLGNVTAAQVKKNVEGAITNSLLSSLKVEYRRELKNIRDNKFFDSPSGSKRNALKQLAGSANRQK